MEAKQLEETGLTEKQAKAYLELLRTPGQNAGKIAKELSIDRTFAYGIMNSLMKKGLVSCIIKENKKAFYASNPDNLLKEIEEKKAKTLNLIKELKSIKQQTKEETLVKIYEGKSGLKVYARDFLQSNEFFTLGGGGELSVLNELKYQYPQYLKELLKKKLNGKIITSVKNIKTLKEMFKNSKIKIRTVEGIESQINFTIFKNKIAIYSAEKKPFAIIIEDKNISSALKAYFDVLWKKI
ncbi:MAG: helix-turn-helix domain-containing protein [Candidatus Aenigmatarchaeota archaeon]